MALIRGGAWVGLLRPGLARVWFYAYFGSRKRGQSRKSFRHARSRAFEKWIGRVRWQEDDDEDND